MRRARATRPRWRYLDIVVAHSTDPALWITDPTQSPFNVGTEIRLEDFGDEELRELNRRYGAPLPRPEPNKTCVVSSIGRPS